MKINCEVEECTKHHDMENTLINEKAEMLLNNIEYGLKLRSFHCNCDINEYTVSIKASLKMTASNVHMIKGCNHFEVHLIKTLMHIDFN